MKAVTLFFVVVALVVLASILMVAGYMYVVPKKASMLDAVATPPSEEDKKKARMLLSIGGAVHAVAGLVFLFWLYKVSVCVDSVESVGHKIKATSKRVSSALDAVPAPLVMRF